MLLLRDEESKVFAEKAFDCDVRLCPDMAFCIGPIQPASSRFLVLTMLRSDLEKAGESDLSAYPEVPREDWTTESAESVRLSKALGAARALLALKPAEFRLRKLDAAHNRLGCGVRQISRGHALVTDRLHVHICSLLLGRPHAVLDNSFSAARRLASNRGAYRLCRDAQGWVL